MPKCEITASEDRKMDFSRTVLVTGGSGFIGSHLVSSLVTSHPDWRIINLDNLEYCCSSRSLESVENQANYTFIKGDVRDSQLVNHLFSIGSIDVIFHLAAQTHVEASFRSASSFQRVNVDGTRVLLDAAHRAGHQPQRFIYVSTDEVYGGSLGEVFDESSPRRPTNPYAVSKVAAEYLVQSYWDKYQFPIIITRSNNIYGPRQYTEKVIPRFLTLLLKNQKCTIQGVLPQSRHFLFVSDAVNAFLLVLERGIVGEIYNVGTSFEIPIVQLARELVKMVKNIADSKVNDWLEFVPERPRVDLRYPIRCEKLQQLGWREQVPWAEGIKQTAQWYQDNPDFWSDVSDDQNIRSTFEKTSNKIPGPT
ncbi:dTDP-D-glucose 4,6-dehydratase isoform X2 [Nothobranchius furzeri]|uniref:dTDP-D-glucose 4,6-dehydratase n=2 Tax=Nothobranchius furzeri TaxID=105023 RepID=A0A9D2Y637_NOTFU|nr:dTDP-D-glucose 4,6-dehydratase isoform X2 [Nothobranchius furzeri]KAF7214737.1 transcript variant X2 [Nothobranchius furzeri]